LKQRELPPVAEDAQDIPPEMAHAIISEVKQAAKRPLSTKMVAQQTLQIFETLNARPPGWAATLGLLFVHASAFGLAAVFALAFVFAQRGDLRDLVSNAAMMPKHKLASDAVRAWNEHASPTNAITLVATFGRPQDAAALFATATNQLPPAASLRLFGESVLLALPAGQDELRRQWLTDFQGRTKDVFVDNTNNRTAFSVFCIATDTNAAEAIVKELNGCLDVLPTQYLIPPWQPRDGRTASERAANDLARQTYLKLQNTQMEFYNDSELEALEKNLAAARKQGDDEAENRFQQQLKTLTSTLRSRGLERVRSGGEGAVDAAVFELYTNMNTGENLTNQAVIEDLSQQLAQRMGQPAPAEMRFSAHFGSATRKGLVINVSFVTFYNLEDGPAALTEWLLQKKCIGFRYEFYPGMGSAGNEDE
jgi:hypothetical protein